MTFKLFKADALQFLIEQPPAFVDTIFVDPPYRLSNGGTTCKSGKRVAVHKGDWDVSEGAEADALWAQGWLEQCGRVLKPSGTIWVSGTHHNIFAVGHAMRRLGFKVLNTITWFKPNASPNLACRYFTHSTESIIWAAPPGQKGKLRHTFNYKEMKAENGGKQMRDLWTIPPPGPSEKTHGKHPTQKPLALLDRIVRASTNPGDVVLDPFCGSGTTGVAALQNGRAFIGIDTNADYLRLAEKRIKAAR